MLNLLMFRRIFVFFINKTTSIFLILKVILLIRSYLIARSLTSVTTFWIFSIVFSDVRKSISSVKDNVVIFKYSCSIFLKILLRYILNRIEDTGDLYKTLVQISCNWQVNPSIINWVCRSVKKESIHLIRKSRIFSLISL